MFRKIVSNLPYSPALVGQLGFYAKRLRKEEVTRRLGLILTALALVVQYFAVFQPPEAANAASESDFIKGGVKSMNEFLGYYDRNSRNIKDILTSVGITRAELKATKKTTINSRDGNVLSWGMTSRFSKAQGESKYTYTKSNGQTGSVYNRPLKLWDSTSYTKKHGSTYAAWIGHSKKFGWFAIMQNCANLVTKKVPPQPKPKAVCSSLTVSSSSRTRFTLKATGTASNGAKINGYTFTIKDSSNKTINTKKVNSSNKTASYTYEAPSEGKYGATVKIHTSIGDKSGTQCQVNFGVDTPTPKPVAVCSSLAVEIINRTNVRFTGSAHVVDATISEYTIVIKNSSGEVVEELSVKSTSAEQAFDSINLSKVGNYTATLTVSTSTGDTTSEDCVKQFTIVEPEACPYHPSIRADDPQCQPCPDPNNPSVWINSPECAAKIIESKTAINLDQAHKLAATTTAQASERISYTITVENRGFAAHKAPITEQLHDVLEYATLVDAGGGTLDTNLKTLTWPEIEIKPGEKQVRTFVVQLASKIPATNTGTSDGASYDCRMTNTFGNSIDIPVACPVEKIIVEQTIRELPETGPRENMLFAAILLSVVTYFYARSRQMNKEVRLIRRSLHTGTI